MSSEKVRLKFDWHSGKWMLIVAPNVFGRKGFNIVARYGDKYGLYPEFLKKYYDEKEAVL